MIVLHTFVKVQTLNAHDEIVPSHSLRETEDEKSLDSKNTKVDVKSTVFVIFDAWV